MKKFIIAEKPSVANDLARVMSVPKKGDFFENEDWLIDCAVGHLVELYMPDDIDPKLKSWKVSSLPILPVEFQLKPIARTKKKYQQLKKHLKRKDVELVINGCDAGREGELIFNYIYELSKSKLPIKRLWMTSMTDNSIKGALKNLKEADQRLLDAAKCRSESDWLLGINGTRAVTLKRNITRNRQVSTVGRVQTPTLALVVDRDSKIQKFTPTTFYKILAEFSLKSGQYSGVYQKPKFKKSDKNEHDRVDRIWDESTAASVLNDLQGQTTADVSETKKRSHQSSGKLYDLTALQRDANRLYHFSASSTLRFAQALYEKHKAITYPRTDSTALPEDYCKTCEDILTNLPSEFSKFSKTITDEKWIDGSNKQIFNDKKISDHFAIIPTETPPHTLDVNERKIYNLITRRFLSVFYPPADWDITTRTSKIGEHSFKTEGRVLVNPSWLEIYGKDLPNKEELVPLLPEDNKTATVMSTEKNQDATKPPAYFSEATLLSAMEGAGKYVDDEDLSEILKERGLGTPATRASTIEHLIKEDYLTRESNQLHSTDKAYNLLEFLRAADADVLTSATMTGDWEYKLRNIERGDLTRIEFMGGVTDLTKSFVEKTIEFKETLRTLKKTSLETPTDQEPIYLGLNYFQNESGTFKIPKKLFGRSFTEQEVGVLIKDKKLGPFDDFVSKKKGTSFRATLECDDNYKISPVFDNPTSPIEDEKKYMADAPEIGVCPVCKSKIKQTELSYICEDHQRVSEGTCNFRITRTMLKAEITPTELLKLIENGKTDLIKGFISKKTNRPFDAQLILKPKGKIGFEFPPRKAFTKKKS